MHHFTCLFYFFIFTGCYISVVELCFMLCMCIGNTRNIGNIENLENAKYWYEILDIMDLQQRTMPRRLDDCVSTLKLCANLKVVCQPHASPLSSSSSYSLHLFYCVYVVFVLLYWLVIYLFILCLDLLLSHYSIFLYLYLMILNIHVPLLFYLYVMLCIFLSLSGVLLYNLWIF